MITFKMWKMQTTLLIKQVKQSKDHNDLGNTWQDLNV